MYRFKSQVVEISIVYLTCALEWPFKLFKKTVAEEIII